MLLPVVLSAIVASAYAHLHVAILHQRDSFLYIGSYQVGFGPCAVQVLQLLQPLYLLIMILQRLRVKFIIFAAIRSDSHKQWAGIYGD